MRPILSFRRPSAVLPIDGMPRVRVSNKSTNRGLSYTANQGIVPSPVRRPFTPWDNAVFPWVKPSTVGPDAIVPKFGYSENTFSPVFHRAADPKLVPVVRQQFKGKAKGSQRVTGKNVPWPFASPSYPLLMPGAIQNGS